MKALQIFKFMSICRINTFLCIIFIAFACHKKPEKDILHTISTEGSAWRINLANVDGKDEKEIILGMYDGTITCITHEGEALWSYNADGFPFAVNSADLDEDGFDDVVIGTSAGSVIAVSSKGKKLWSFKSLQPIFNVSIGKFVKEKHITIACGGIDRKVYLLDNKGKLLDNSFEVERVVGRMIAANLDNDPEDELLVIANRTIAHLIDFSSGKAKQNWKTNLKVPEGYVNWENPGGNFYAFSVCVDDIDQDGYNEVILGDTYFNKQPVMALNHLGKAIWITPSIPFKQIDTERHTEFFSSALVQSGELVDSIPGNEILSLAGGTMRLIDQKGNILDEVEAAIGFTDFKLSDGKVYFSASPNGDKNIYYFNWDTDWKQKMLSFKREGNIATISKDINQLAKQVKAAPKNENAPTKTYMVGFGKAPINDVLLQKYHEERNWWHMQFPYKNIYTNVGMKVLEKSPPLDQNGKPWSYNRWQVDAINGTFTVDEILHRMSFLEKHRIRTKLTIGHSVMPFITLKTAEKILQTAPNATYGFYTAEDEQFERLDQYYQYYYSPLATLCKKYGNKYCVTKNKNVWWFNTPSHQNLSDLLFASGNEKIIKAETEDSNSRTPEINLMSRLGLFLSGKIDGLITNVHRDMFSFNRYHEWEYPKHGHPYLRLMIAHTLLGADEYNLRFPFKINDNRHFVFTQMGKESVEIFFHLLGKGIIWKPSPKDMVGISSLGIAVHPPSEKWIRDGINGHRPELWEKDNELDSAVIPHNGTNWGLSPTPNHALQKVLFNKQYQFGAFIPATPYGLVAMIPYHFNLNNVPHIKEWLHTDGTYLWKEGSEKVSGTEAANLLRLSYEKAAQQLPFRVNGNVFTQVLKMKDQGYRIVMIDPGWVNPSDQVVNIKCQLAGQWQFKDVLSSELISPDSEIKILAGTFRIIDAQLISQ